MTRYGTGSGITWGSDPVAELAELEVKAAILDADAAEFSLLETMRCEPATGVRNLGRHLDRLCASAQYFGFAVEIDGVRRALAQAAAEVTADSGPARLRLLVDRSGAVTVQRTAWAPAGADPVRLALDLEPADSAQPWLSHKTTRRDVYTVRAGRHPMVDDVLLVNENGCVTESTIATIAASVDGRWLTPPCTDGCLPGVERARLLDRGKLLEGSLSVAEVRTADALATLSSLRGWRRAILVGD